MIGVMYLINFRYWEKEFLDVRLTFLSSCSLRVLCRFRYTNEDRNPILYYRVFVSQSLGVPDSKS